MSDADATQARQDVVANVDEIIEHVINANISSMPYEVYSELFDAVDGLGVEIENLQAENAKLRDAMYAKAGKHALQHMDEDELRIWATQQSEYIEKLRELCADMLTCINAYKARKSICWECEHHRDVDELRSACFLGSDARELGIEVTDA